MRGWLDDRPHKCPGGTALCRPAGTARRPRRRNFSGCFVNDEWIGLPHGERPRLYLADRKSERDPVNETKPALFFPASNDRVADHTDTEIFATLTACASA